MGTETEQARSRAGGSAGRVGIWLRQARGFTKRYALELFRDKAALFWSILFPTGFYLLAIVLFVSDVPGVEQADLYASVAIGYGTFGAIIAGLTSFGTLLAADIDSDRYRLYRSMSIAPSADLAGRLLAGVALSLTAFLVVVPVAWLTGARFALRSPLSVLVVGIALVAFALVWMVLAVVVAVAIRNPNYTSMFTVGGAIVAYMLTGYNGTEVSFYRGPDVLLNLMPHTLATRVIADHLLVETAALSPPAVPSTGPALAGLVGCTALLLVVGFAVARRFLYVREVIP